jgi:phospholipase C
MSNGPSAAVTGLAAVDSVVVLMLENRSFDHMPGFLYPGSTSPSGQPFDGLTGTGSHPGSDGKPVTVFTIEPGTPSACYMPGAGPGEGWSCSASPIGVSPRPGPADLLAR